MSNESLKVQASEKPPEEEAPESIPALRANIATETAKALEFGNWKRENVEFLIQRVKKTLTAYERNKESIQGADRIIEDLKNRIAGYEDALRENSKR